MDWPMTTDPDPARVPDGQLAEVAASFDAAGLRLLQVVSSLDPDRYTVETWEFGDSVYKIKVQPTGDRHRRVIDVDLYRRHGPWAWCPQFAPRAAFTPGSAAHRLIRHACRRMAGLFLERNGHRLSGHVGLKLVHTVYTWWVPVKFFDEPELREWDGVRLSVPRDPEEYLAFRYGNWGTPAPGWSFLDDDSGLKHRHPRRLVA